jgi:hypothetical protein
MPVFTYAVGEKLAGEKTALGLRPCTGLASGVWSSAAPLVCNKNISYVLNKQFVIIKVGTYNSLDLNITYSSENCKSILISEYTHATKTKL